MDAGDGSQDLTHKPPQHIARMQKIVGGGIMWKGWLWTIIVNIVGECHIHCTLKTSFVNF